MVKKSRYKDPWYGSVLRVVLDQKQLAKEKSPQALLYMAAIKKAGEDLAAEEDGADKVKAMKLMYIDELPRGVIAEKVNMSEYTVRNLACRYVRMVARYAGWT